MLKKKAGFATGPPIVGVSPAEVNWEGNSGRI
jgi:hypothetical protein